MALFQVTGEDWTEKSGGYGAWRYGFVYLKHQLLEFLSVLGFFYGISVYTKKLYAHIIEVMFVLMLIGLYTYYNF